MNDALARTTTPAAGQKKIILKARAKALAREITQTASAEAGLEVIEFVLAYEHYALETVHVREVHPLKEITPLPCTPAFVCGIINVRGQILTVIDLKKFFDLPEKGIADLHQVIIVRVADIEIGILADVVIGVRSIPQEAVQRSLPTLTGLRQDYLKGVTNERLVILDAEKILSDKRLVVHEEVET